MNRLPGDIIKNIHCPAHDLMILTDIRLSKISYNAEFIVHMLRYACICFTVFLKYCEKDRSASDTRNSLRSIATSSATSRRTGNCRRTGGRRDPVIEIDISTEMSRISKKERKKKKKQ